METPGEQPARGHRKALIAAAAFGLATYLSFLTWWAVPAYRGPLFARIGATYLTAYWLWVAAQRGDARAARGERPSKPAPVLTDPAGVS